MRDAQHWFDVLLLLKEGSSFSEMNSNHQMMIVIFLCFFSGAADTDETLQRRKERYRQELQEQIAEQHRNRKRSVITDPCLFMCSRSTEKLTESLMHSSKALSLLIVPVEKCH